MTMKGAGGSAINSFTGGMVSDMDALSAKNNTYKYAENARISQSGALGSLSNIEDFSFNLELPSDAGTFMSYCKTDEFTILVSRYQSKLKVYKYITIDGEEKCILVATLEDGVDSTRIDNIKSISLVSSIESSKIHRLYFADGIHGIYSINIYRPDMDDANVDYKIALIEYGSTGYELVGATVSANRVGSLDAGKYFYVVRYTNDSGSESSDVFISNGINATVSDSYGGIIDSETGSPSQSNTAVNILIDSVDDSAYGINVYRIYYYGSMSNPKIHLIYSDKIKRVNGVAAPINISDSDSAAILNDVSDSILFNNPIKIASVIETKDNLLFAGDIDLKRSSVSEYDVRAFPFNKAGLFRYRNYVDQTERAIEISSFDLPSFTPPDHDFISDNIYSSERYRDVAYRYNIKEDGSIVYGGRGKNVSYEFIHSYLIAAEEGSIFTNRAGDSSWFKQSQFIDTSGIAGTCNINDSNLYRKEESCFSLIDLNATRDDLTIRYGDKDRDISHVTIKHQNDVDGYCEIESVDINDFGIEHHTGKFDYSNMVLANTFAGFKRNEIYRFAVKFKLTDGTFTEPMWISDIRFPANYMININDEPALPGNPAEKDVFSFSSFTTSEDTKEGFNLLNSKLMDSATWVHGGFSNIAYEDQLGYNDLSRAELLVKPLGIKFEFNNVPLDVESAIIMYTPLSLIERTILGQFIVSRLGGFTNSGIKDTAVSAYHESSCDGFAYPHPIPSMKYTYGIGPIGAELNPQDINADAYRTSCFNYVTAKALGFDIYSGAANPIICGSSSNPDTYTKQNLQRTTSISTSPYYSDINNYLIASPEISYSGQLYFDIINNLNDSIVFENLIYSKNSKPWSSPSTNGKSWSIPAGVIPEVFNIYPTIGNDSNYEYDYESVNFIPKFKAYGNKTAYISSLNNGTNGNTIFASPWNDNYANHVDATKFLEPNEASFFGSLPTFMYCGSMLSKDERLSSKADDSVVTLSSCGPTTFSILEAVLWFRLNSAGGGLRLGDSIFTVGFNKTRYLSATSFKDSSVSMMPMNVSIDASKVEKVWDDTNTYGTKTNLPISLKTIMSGVGAIISTIYRASDDDTHIDIAYNSGYSTKIQDLDSRYEFFTDKLRLGSEYSQYVGTNALNSVTFKYYKSHIPERIYKDTSASQYGISELTDKYISFIFQNSKEFSDNRLALSNKEGILMTNYNPLNDTFTTPNHESGVWDLKPVKIVSSEYSGILESPISPFSLNNSIRLSKYNGYINYSKTLVNEMYGAKRQRNDDAYPNPSSSLFSNKIPFNDEMTSIDSLEFVTMNALKRGRLSGKHGACGIISLDGTIPMIGHMMNIDRKLDLFLFRSMKVLVDQMNAAVGNPTLYDELNNKLKRTRLYWHMLDGAVSAHTSTFLVDIRSKFNFLLKNSTVSDKKNSKYIETAQSINFEQSTLSSNVLADRKLKHYVFGGDTYVTLFDYTSTYGNKAEPHISYNNDPDDILNWNSTAMSSQSARLNILVPIESFINTHIDSGATNHKSPNTWHLDKATYGINSPNSGYSSSPYVFTQNKDEFEYMDAYSAKKNFNQMQLNNSNDDIYNTYEYKSRVISSEKKILGEQNDSWSIFKPNNYIDLNPSNGSINGLVNFNNRLYAFQDKAIAFLSVNERSVVTDSGVDSAQLLLGTGGILQYYSYATESFGLLKEHMNAVSKSTSGIYFYDGTNSSICRVVGAVQDVSKITGTKEISQSIIASELSSIIPWKINDEIIFNFDTISYLGKDNKSMMFYETGNAFESMITSDYDFMFEFGSDVRTICKSNNDIYVNKPTPSPISNMVVAFTVNGDAAQTKIFDSVDINMSWTHNSTVNNASELYSMYMNSISNTGQYKSITDSIRARQNKNANIRAAIHRVDGTISRMRDKYLESWYSFDGGYRLSLPYIKTNYRYSIV